MEKAIKKIKAEMGKEKNPYVQVVGQFLLQHLESRPEDSENILNPDKTILKSLDAMKKEAEKKKVGNCAVLTDQEGFDIVLKYFNEAPKVKESDQVQDQSVETQEDIDFDFDELLD